MKHLRIFTFCVLALSLSTATVQAQNLSIDSVYFDRSTGLINTLVSGVGDKEYRFDLELRSPVSTYKPNKDKVAKVTKAIVKQIAEQKMVDLNANTVEAAMSMVAGTARSMGIVVED